ncbi:MAG: hypothetical protein WCA22_16360, partial [Candidatus Binatus sp.]
RRKSYGNINCQKVYPVLQTKKEMSELKTVAFQLTKDQAIDLAKKLLGAAQNSQVIDVTGFRLRNLITVTTPPA